MDSLAQRRTFPLFGGASRVPEPLMARRKDNTLSTIVASFVEKGGASFEMDGDSEPIFNSEGRGKFDDQRTELNGCVFRPTGQSTSIREEKAGQTHFLA